MIKLIIALHVIYPGTDEKERVVANLGLRRDEKVAARAARVPRVRGRLEKQELIWDHKCIYIIINN